MNGNVDNVYLQYGEVEYLIMSFAVGPQIYGEKEEIVSIFRALINRPMRVDSRNNGDDHRKKWETKNTHNQNTV